MEQSSSTSYDADGRYGSARGENEREGEPVGRQGRAVGLRGFDRGRLRDTGHALRVAVMERIQRSSLLRSHGLGQPALLPCLGGVSSEARRVHA